MIDTAAHRPLIDALLQRYHLSAPDLEVVENVVQFSREHGIEDEGLSRIAKCFQRPDGSCHIVISSVITDDMIESAKSAMLYRGLIYEIGRLSKDEDFLRHTVLHEIACHVLKTGEQEARDRWAFEGLDRLATP